MSLENAIEENTKALRGIAASLAVIVAKGYMPTVAAEAAKEVAKEEPEPKAEKPKAEPKAEKPKAEAKAEKPVAEKSDKDLMQEVLEEADAENAAEPEEDLLGTGSEESAEEDEVPALPAGKRDLDFAKNYLVTPIFSKMHRDELKKILDEFGAARITEIPSDKWDDLYAVGYRLLKSAGKI